VDSEHFLLAKPKDLQIVPPDSPCPSSTSSMFSILRRLQLPVVLVTVTGCATMDPAAVATLPGDLLALPGAIHTLGSRPTSAHDVMHKVGTAMAIVATVQRYAALTTVQKRKVEQVVTRKYDGMVQREKRTLAPRYASRKSEVQKRGAAKVAQARKTSPAAAAKVEAETQKEVAKVDLEWEKAAKSSVARNYGTDFAVPVQNREGKAVVAFASVRESGVSVSDSSYEVASTPVALGSSQKVSHGGRTYAVLDEKVGP
jgi:hypothetical protein